MQVGDKVRPTDDRREQYERYTGMDWEGNGEVIGIGGYTTVLVRWDGSLWPTWWFQGDLEVIS